MTVVLSVQRRESMSRCASNVALYSLWWCVGGWVGEGRAESPAAARARLVLAARAAGACASPRAACALYAHERLGIVLGDARLLAAHALVVVLVVPVMMTRPTPRCATWVSMPSQPCRAGPPGTHLRRASCDALDMNAWYCGDDVA